ncbi:type IV secretion protein Rhs [Kluyvera intermedia]|uniref:type IV secretion protein Rhs n=2 Tax=Kluyvera intermedia TaxID=61648 RepID=UPI00242C1806|nr:type IV secretion protein Rhs [Kluyvera intermedia]WEJ86653.1 MAG: type IV secretion protein Rhs [Kluyvera intermedia]
MMKYVLLLLFLLCGCSPIDIDPAIKKVNTFHDLYKKENYSQIYKMTSTNFQKETPEKNFINIMAEAKEKDLGALKKSTLKFERGTHSLLSNNEISLIYYSEYSKRIVQELFIFEIESGETKLKGYRYDSIN